MREAASKTAALEGETDGEAAPREESGELKGQAFLEKRKTVRLFAMFLRMRWHDFIDH